MVKTLSKVRTLITAVNAHAVEKCQATTHRYTHTCGAMRGIVLRGYADKRANACMRTAHTGMLESIFQDAGAGCRDAGTPGCRDAGTPGRRDAGTPGCRDWDAVCVFLVFFECILLFLLASARTLQQHPD